MTEMTEMPEKLWRPRLFVAVVVSALCVLFPGAAAVAAEPDLVGDPVVAGQYWGRQSSDDCALMAVADVVGQLTGVKPAEDDVIALAVATPSSKEGAPPVYIPAPDPHDPPPTNGSVVRRNQLPVIRDLPMLLDHYGVPSILTDDVIAGGGGPPTGIPGLHDALAGGKKVIVSLNGETIWDKPGDRSIHDHDVVVTGLDTGTGIVHLNDSAAAGPDSQIPIDVFDAAWQTSAHSMVIAG